MQRATTEGLTTDMEHLPITCTLTDDALRARRRGVLAEVAAMATNKTKVTAGYRFEFPATSEALTRITAMVEAERQCCRFLRFMLTVEPDLGPIALEITGPQGAKDFLDALFETA